ncbi:hypothetical protein GCM10011351_09430 [Paraliobacillus quinghaiensis]|uniref:Uncharacterized protein n=1 Tax=Paraliobacillus quinghaiensis TaxID=470815 RepID=A0A917WRQ9_9BACI|nr:hypothetical protein GCM10011351_09430 [Paraliobacillus quinghaiensis]
MLLQEEKKVSNLIKLFLLFAVNNDDTERRVRIMIIFESKEIVMIKVKWWKGSG